MNDKSIKNINASSKPVKDATKVDFKATLTGFSKTPSTVCYTEASNAGGLTTGPTPKVPFACPIKGFESPSTLAFKKNIETFKKGISQVLKEEQIYTKKSDGTYIRMSYGTVMPLKLGKAGQYVMGLLSSAAAGSEAYKAVECLNNKYHRGFKSHTINALAGAGLSFLSFRGATSKKISNSKLPNKGQPTEVQPSSEVLKARSIPANSTEYMVRLSIPEMIPQRFKSLYSKAISEPAGMTSLESKVFREYTKTANDSIFYYSKIQSNVKGIKQFETIIVEQKIIEFDALKRAYALTKGKLINNEPIFGSFYEFAQNNKLSIDSKTLSKYITSVKNIQLRFENSEFRQYWAQNNTNIPSGNRK